MAECEWATDEDRSSVLTRLCEAMAQDRLETPFWIQKYFIRPTSQKVEESGRDACIQYMVHITRPTEEPEKPAAPPTPPRLGNQTTEKPQQERLKQASEEEEPLEAWQCEITEEEEEPPEDWQRELEEGEVLEENDSTLYHMDDGSKRSGGGMKRKQKKEMVSLALPFLTGISPAGFLSARRRQAGGADHLVQVNGKLYPLAKIQLGKMGALHPANRLAAYLTGRVGSGRKQLGSPSKPPQTQSSVPTPQTNFLASSNIVAADTPPPQTQPSIPAVTAPPSSTALDQSAARTQVTAVRLYQTPAAGGGQVTPAASGSSTPSTASQVQLVKPCAGPAAVPGPGVTGVLPTGQRVVLQPVHRAGGGGHYYRIPDGRLVQLLPISKLRAGCAPPSLLPPATGLRPVEIPPQTSLPPSPFPSPLSGLQSFPGPPRPPPPGPGSGFLSQKMKCTFKILPTNSKKERIFISCAKPPPLVVTTPSTSLQSPSHPPAPPSNPLSLKLSKGQGAELNSKAVKVSADSVIARQLSAFQKPTTSQTPPPASGSEVTPLPPSQPPAGPELASDLVDLDIVCVDEEMRPIPTESEVVDLVASSSGDTENSSDFGDEPTINEEKETTGRQRQTHNLLERRRRVRLHQMFRGLRREIGLKDNKTSKLATLNTAEQVIQELRWTEARLTEKKRRLTKRRDHFLSTIVPTGQEEQRVLKKQERHRAANQLQAPAVGGGASEPQAPVGGGASEPNLSTGNNIDNDIIFISSNVQLPTLQAPPTTAQPSTKPVQRLGPGPGPVPVPVQRPVPVAAPVPVIAPHPVAVLKSVQDAVYHIAPVVRDRLKTKPNILSRSRRPAPSSLLPAGDAPAGQVLVPADLLSRIGAALPGQQILALNPLMALQATPESRTFSEASNRLHLPQPPQVVPAGPVLPSDQILDQTPSSSTTLSPGLSADCGSEVGHLGSGSKTRADGGAESPTSLNEIVSTAGVSYEVDHAGGGAKEPGHTHSSELDSDNSAAIETERGGLQGHKERTQTGPQTGPTDGSTTANALAPPPLLQMKVGGAKVVDSASSDRAAAADRREEAVPAWRPMPRLVPLGLRGNPPS